MFKVVKVLTLGEEGRERMGRRSGEEGRSADSNGIPWNLTTIHHPIRKAIMHVMFPLLPRRTARSAIAFVSDR